MRVALDNDIILKSACYGLLNEVSGVLAPSFQEVGVLGASRYVVRAAVKKHVPDGERATIDAALDAFFGGVQAIELTEEERTLAAEIEYLAQKQGLALDVGESQLCVAVVVRDVEVLATGDKRAIAALAVLVGQRAELIKLTGRVRCLEQLILEVLGNCDPSLVRQAICTRPTVDKALSLAFSCGAAIWSPDGVAAGLRSYIGNLRTSAGHVLASDPAITASGSGVP